MIKISILQPIFGMKLIAFSEQSRAFAQLVTFPRLVDMSACVPGVHSDDHGRLCWKGPGPSLRLHLPSQRRRRDLLREPEPTPGFFQ